MLTASTSDALLAAVQAARRCRRRGAGAAAELSAVRASDAARSASRRGPTISNIHGAWSIDFASVERGARRRGRAPCWSSARTTRPGRSFARDELDRLAAICAPRGIAIIADEVFADYELEPGARAARARALARDDVLSFALGGLSKSVGPAAGEARLDRGRPDPTALVDAALERLELMCDTYLSVSTPVQRRGRRAARRAAPASARQIAARVVANYRPAAGGGRARRRACRVLRSRRRLVRGAAGAVVRVGGGLVVDSLTADGVLAHPGYFFDFPRESFLDRQPAAARGGVRRRRRRALLRHFDCTATGHELHSSRPPPRGPAHPAVLVSVDARAGASATSAIFEPSPRGWRPPGSASCSCCRSTRWRPASSRRTRRSARWRSIRSSSACRASPSSPRSAARHRPRRR